jgi:hypothetical protein
VQGIANDHRAGSSRADRARSAGDDLVLRRGPRLRLEAFSERRKALHFGSQKINLQVAGHELEPMSAHPTSGSADLCFLTERPLAEIGTHLASLCFPII